MTNKVRSIPEGQENVLVMALYDVIRGGLHNTSYFRINLSTNMLCPGTYGMSSTRIMVCPGTYGMSIIVNMLCPLSIFQC